MLAKGPGKKVTISLNEDAAHHMTPLHDAGMTFLLHKGISGATVTRAMHTPKVEVPAQHLPIRIEFVETLRKVDEVLPKLYEMVSDGLIEVQDTTVIKHAREGQKPEPGVAHERRDLPMMISFIDSAEKIGRLVPVLAEMIPTGLMATSPVQMIRVQKTSQ